MSSHFSHIPFPDNRAIRMQRIGTTELKACALKQWADKVGLEECYSRGRQARWGLFLRATSCQYPYFAVMSFLKGGHV